MLINHTGDVVRAEKSALRAGGELWTMDIQDATTKMLVRVNCIGKMARFASQVKTGQVINVLGWIVRPPTYGAAMVVTPFVVMAKSGTNEQDLNTLALEYSREMVAASTEAATLRSEVDILKDANTTLTASNASLAVRADGLEASVKELRDENLTLRDRLEEADRQLQYERLLNGVAGGET